MNDASEYLPRDGEFDPLTNEGEQKAVECPNENAGHNISISASTQDKKQREPMIRFYTPSELKGYTPPANQCLVGDYHLQRGAVSVMAGPPGCGKSRASLALAVCGARGTGTWLGMKVSSQFRTLIIQNENGLTRLHRDIDEMSDIEGLDEWIRISAPPVYGLALANPEFRNQLKQIVKEFKPHLVIIDPWNACVRDSMEKDFQEGITRLREVLAESPNEPACLILHHLRKPKSDDRHRGRNLAHLLSGSYVLVSVARSVLVMQPASDDTEDDRVVVTCAKNNDGELGPRSAWRRGLGTFEHVSDFDWEAFDSGSPSQRQPKVTEEHVRQAFGLGIGPLQIKQVADRLQEIASVGRSAAYNALKTDEGARFAYLLVRQPGTALISLRDNSA